MKHTPLLTAIFTAALVLASLVHAGDATFYQLRDGIPNAKFYLQKNQVGNQYWFFIGDRILAGEGLRDPSLRYSAQLVKAFKKYYPETSIIETRHMQPGGGWFAQYRTSGGQAVFGEVICSGYLAILDFTAGDRGVDKLRVQRQLEGQFRQILRYRPTHSTLVLYTLTPEIFEAYRSGATPDYIAWCEEVADHYGVPTLNLAKFAADRILAGEAELSDFTFDEALPTDAGAQVYAEAVHLFADALYAAHPAPESPTRKALPAPLLAETNDDGRIVAYETTEFTSGWSAGQESPLKPFRHVLVAERPGEVITLKFQGTEAGLVDVAGPDSCELEFALDGGAWQMVAAPSRPEEFRLRALPLVEGLDRTQDHTLAIRTASEGVERFGGFLLNGTTTSPFEGMSALERIDAIYAAMDPISYDPEPGRFRYLPRTIKTLREGGTLRMVLLGDSIMGNTSGSSFELLLERRYPKCDVVKIASLRSSTGCRYYQNENRVEEYVLRHAPDVLLIGGISNGNDWEAIRSVVRQCRARLPELEIVLITPVFGSSQDSHIRNWERVPTEAQNPFRYNLRKVAEEEKCAFFDMTGPWWEYVAGTGKAYGWFMGDAVHANARGSQIIGRLLDIYFDGTR